LPPYVFTRIEKIFLANGSNLESTNLLIRPLILEKKVMGYLGLGVTSVSNQIIQRDRHIEFVMFMANLATTLDKICMEIRTLQGSEIGEVQEFFGKKQVGSSTMPHKKNPIKFERVSGLARRALEGKSRMRCAGIVR